MLFQRPHISQTSRGPCHRPPPQAARTFGACDSPPPPNKSNLATAVFTLIEFTLPCSFAHSLANSGISNPRHMVGITN